MVDRMKHFASRLEALLFCTVLCALFAVSATAADAGIVTLESETTRVMLLSDAVVRVEEKGEHGFEDRTSLIAAGRGDFTKIPGGMPGVETRGTLLFTYGIAAGRITAERMADVLAETPAKLYGLFPRKGVLQPGADADIVVYDPRGTSCITAADQAANVDYAPYEGTQIAGHIAEVYLRGTCVVREGKILHDRNGQYLHRGKCML